MQTYKKYKKTNIPWLGDTPNHWKILPCRAVVTNKTDKNDGGAITEYLSLMANIGVVRYEDKGDIGNKKPDDLSKCKIVKSGNLVINSMNYAIGSYGMSGYNGICSPVYIVMEPRKDVIEQRYALRLFENRPMQKHLALLGNGILEHRAAIKWDDIKPQHIALPPLDEQRAILKFIDRETSRIDDLIVEKQAFIKLLKEKHQALISHVMTKGLNPDAKMEYSGVEWVGHVPKHWSFTRLKYVGNIQSGIAKGKDVINKKTISVPMLRVANVQESYLNLNDVHNINIEPHELDRYSLEYGDVLMNEGGDNDKLGRGAVWRSQISPCIHQNHVFALRMTKIEPEWLELITQTSYAKFYFYYHSKQSTNLASISSTKIKQLPVPVPPQKERKEITRYLSAELSKSKATSDEVLRTIELLKEQRIALISAAVTGKIDVRNQ